MQEQLENRDDLNGYLSKISQFFKKKYGIIYTCLYADDINGKLIYGYSSDSAWQEVFVGENLFKYCHLMDSRDLFFRSSTENRFIMPWECVPPRNLIERKVVQARTLQGIGSGCSIGMKNEKIKVYLAVCPEPSEKKFISLFFENVIVFEIVLENLFNRIIKIVEMSEKESFTKWASPLGVRHIVSNNIFSIRR